MKDPESLASSSARSRISNILEAFDHSTEAPALFLNGFDDNAECIKMILREMYSVTKQTEKLRDGSSSQTVSSLLTDNFDLEQIWQQIELHNSVKNNHFASFRFNTDESLEGEQEDEEKGSADDADTSEEFSTSESDSEVSDLDDTDCDAEQHYSAEEEGQEEDDDEGNSKKNIEMDTRAGVLKKGKASTVDDDFFRLSEMEEFLTNEEKAEERGSQNGPSELINYFEDIPSDSSNNEGARLMYSDFFDQPHNQLDNSSSRKKKKSVRFVVPGKSEEQLPDFNEEGITSDDEVEMGVEKGQQKTSFEKRQERINKRVEQLEEEIVSEKPWQMRGEVTAKKRPQNSLLEEALEFDLTSRPPPIITEKVAEKLQDIIERRIRDKAWDDVERKIKPVDTPMEYKKKLVLSQEKSKLSLAEIYEKEYMRQREEKANAKDSGGQLSAVGEHEQEESAEHKRVKSMMELLFKKLDALSNYHFTPLPIKPTIEIVENMPAVTMEEPASTLVTDAALLAPEEVCDKPKGALVGKEERSATDKKRERRKKKSHQRRKQNEVQKREKTLNRLNKEEVKNNKYAKEKIQRELKQLTKNKNTSLLEQYADNKKVLASSGSFFSALQEGSTTAGVKSKRKTKDMENGGFNSNKKKKIK